MEGASLSASDCRQEEENPPPSSGPLPAKGVLTVTKQEWDQIEDVPFHTRAVGQLFQEAGKALQGTSGAGRPRLEVASRRAFDEQAYLSLQGAAQPDGAASKKRGGGRGGAAAGRSIQDRTAQAFLEKDRRKAQEAALLPEPPRREAFSNRPESFVHASLLWLRRQSLSVQVTLAPKLLSWLRQTFQAPPRALEEQLEALAQASGALALQVLEELCEDEAPLAADFGASELRLHSEQETLVRELRAAVAQRTPLLLRYRTPPSGGKSSATALLGAALGDLKDVFLLYACYSRPVRIDVCKHLVAACVPFAICVQGIASPSYGCYFSGKGRKPHAPPPPDAADRVAYSLRVLAACDRRPVALVCDLLSTQLFLRARSQDILLFDEPTADVAGALAADVRGILAACPARTVLMSATIPPFAQLASFVEHFERRHGAGARLFDLQSARLPMSVAALSPEGQLLAPHDFGATLEEIQADGHLRRFYAPRVLRALQPAPEEEELCCADLCSYEAVRQACLRLLRQRGSGLPRPLPRARAHEALDLARSCTEHAELLPGTSLLVLDDQRVIHRALARNLEGLPSLRRMLRAFRRAAEQKQEKRANGKEQEEEAREGWLDGEEGLLDKKYVLNSRSHLARFSKRLESFPRRLYRPRLYMPEDVLDTSCEEYVEGALCGVLYMGAASADPAYEAASQTLAERALESFVVGGRTLIYGLNLPFDRLVVGCEGLSRPELVQLCGRVGRSCRGSSKAEIVFLHKATARLALSAEPEGREDASVGRLFAVQ
jgi:hypothetical protein